MSGLRRAGLRSAIIAAAALFALPGCGTRIAALVDQQLAEPAVYPMPPGAVRGTLARTQLPPLVFGDTMPALRVETDGGSRVVWIVMRQRAEIMRFVATLSLAGDGGTRIDLALAGATTGRFGNVEQRLAANPTVRVMYLVAMREQIAAELERRPFDMTKVYPALAAATQANMGAILDRFDNSGDEFRRRDREAIEKAYRDEAAGKAY